MKWLKNITRLLVLISLSLSLTPLTTAKADDTTTTDKEANSEVSVNVLSGILTLEAVPDFNFGTTMVGSTSNLKNNTANVEDFNNSSANGTVTAGEDGNSTGLLEMIDSRNYSSTMPGFTLTATMGKLSTSDGSYTLPAVLKLGGLPLLNGDNENISTSSEDMKTLNATIGSPNDTSEGTTGTVIALNKGSYNAGVIKANYNTPDSASLTIPGTNDGSVKSSKNMNAVITWTLSAAPTVTD